MNQIESRVTINDLISLGFKNNLDKPNIFYRELNNPNTVIIVENPETESELFFLQKEIDSVLHMSLLKKENEIMTLKELTQLVKA